eukprot:GHVR01051454.1.p1 GENE.GHVR01051454.1~~GHVR01051454.1.p1  ORF type:complete len:329 (+),score=54.52 GHVR01051454.1:46-1032(+)
MLVRCLCLLVVTTIVIVSGNDVYNEIEDQIVATPIIFTNANKVYNAFKLKLNNNNTTNSNNEEFNFDDCYFDVYSSEIVFYLNTNTDSSVPNFVESLRGYFAARESGCKEIKENKFVKGVKKIIISNRDDIKEEELEDIMKQDVMYDGHLENQRKNIASYKCKHGHFEVIIHFRQSRRNLNSCKIGNKGIYRKVDGSGKEENYMFYKSVFKYSISSKHETQLLIKKKPRPYNELTFVEALKLDVDENWTNFRYTFDSEKWVSLTGFDMFYKKSVMSKLTLRRLLQKKSNGKHTTENLYLTKNCIGNTHKFTDIMCVCKPVCVQTCVCV